MGLVKLVQQRPEEWKLRPDQKAVVKGEWNSPDARLNAAERILAQLAKVGSRSAYGRRAISNVAGVAWRALD